MTHFRPFLFPLLALATLISPSRAATPPDLVPAVEFTPRAGLPNVLARLAANQPVRIAYIGGSITATENGWRDQTTAFLRKQYPAAPIEEINAAIGGTGSDLGVFRFNYDVLRHRPHLIFIEFAVNDSFAPQPQILRWMEGMVRQAWALDPSIDLCFVYTIKEDMLPILRRGLLPASASAMEKVADHYAIPSIHMGAKAVEQIIAGTMVISANPKTDADKAALAGKSIFSGDGVHPHLATGHRLYADANIRALIALKTVGSPGPRALPAPLVPNHYQQAKLVPLSRARLSAGWEILDPAKIDFARWYNKHHPQLWAARQPGQSLTLTFKGTHIGFFDVCTPDSGQLLVTLDNQPPRLIPRFTPYTNGAHLTAFTIAQDLPDTTHTLTITLDPRPIDKAAILAKVGDKMNDPRRYQGAAWYPGWIMVVGDVLEAPAQP